MNSKFSTSILIIFLFFSSLIYSQSFSHSGHIEINGKTIKGHFSNQFTKKTTSLKFKSSKDNTIIDLYKEKDVVLVYDNSNRTLKTLDIMGQVSPYVVLVNGKASFYKNVISTVYFMENTSLENNIIELGSLKTASNKNRVLGALSILFNDCIAVRSKISESDVKEPRIIYLTNNYNNCESYTKEFELSEKQKSTQAYSNEKGIFHFDVGLGYSLGTVDGIIPNFSDTAQDDSSGSIIAFVSFNASPKYFNQWKGRLFADITLSYNSTSKYVLEFYDLEKSLITFSVGPKYYFNHTKSIKPLFGLNLGLSLTNYDLTKNTDSNLLNNISESQKDIYVSFEAGVQISNNFEFSFEYRPQFNQDFTVFLNSVLETTNRSFSLKASYFISSRQENQDISEMN